MVSKTIPGTPAERNLQLKQMMWQVFCHGTAVAFVTPNLDTTANPALACIAVGPGEGDLVGEPTVTKGEPLIRLTDLRPELQEHYKMLLTSVEKWRDGLQVRQLAGEDVSKEVQKEITITTAGLSAVAAAIALRRLTADLPGEYTTVADGEQAAIVTKSIAIDKADEDIATLSCALVRGVKG
eukprot:gene29998-42649_t